MRKQSSIRGTRPVYSRRIAETLEPRRLLAASIQGSVREDVNANGVLDAEDTLPIWTPTIYADLNYNGALDAGEPSTTQPFPSSTYRLDLPTGGTYLIRVILPSSPTNYVATIPATGTRTITIADGFTTLGNNFGGWRTGRYAGKPFQDANGNGTHESTEFNQFSTALWADLDRDGVMDPIEPASTPNDTAAQVTVRAGSYAMRLNPRPGWTNTTAPGAFERTVTPQSVNAAEWLGQSFTPHLRGTLANDVNGNELLDPADVGQGGWTVFADRDLDGVFDVGEPFVITQPNGTYMMINSLLSSPFHLRFISPSGQLDPRLHNYNLGAGTSVLYSSADFLVRVTNVASGRIYADLNGNGVHENVTGNSEPYAVRQFVYADLNGNAQADPGEPTTWTENTGFFTFAVPNGTYAVRVVPSDDYALNPSAATAYPATTFGSNARVNLSLLGLLDNRQTRTRNYPSSPVFDDPNRNGLWEPGESLMPGQLVYVDANNNLRRDAGEAFTFTEADGRFRFGEQPTSANSLVRVETTSGWRSTQRGLTDWSLAIYAVPDVGIASAAFDVNDRQAIDLTFTHDLGASLQGGDFVLSVRATDGSWLPLITQYGLEGVSVQDGRTVATLRLTPLIAADFHYRVTLPPESIADAAGTKNPVAQHLEFFVLATDANRDQTVNQADLAILQANFGQSSRTFTQGDFNYDGTVNAADRDILFAKYGQTVIATPGSIAGKVFNDANANGLPDGGEAGISGRTVYLDVDGNGVRDTSEPSRTTDSLGRYSFTSMGPANYAVRQVLPNGWRQTGATPTGPIAITLAVAQAATGADFGATNAPALPSWLASNSAATWNGATKTLSVSGAATISAEPGADGPVIVNASGAAAVLTIAPTSGRSIHLASLNLSNGATATVASVSGRTAANHRVLVLNGLSIDPQSTLDLRDNDLVVDYGVNSPLNSIEGMLSVGNITSSVFVDDDRFSLGVAENEMLPAPYGTPGGGPLFAGQDVDLTAVLIKFTWVSDLNLDGLVDFQDLSVFHTNYDNGLATGRRWWDGDRNYDGRIDFQDLSLFYTGYDITKPVV